MLVNVKGFDYVRGAGLRAPLTAAKLLKTSGGQFKFCEPTDAVQQALEISGFHSLLSVYATEGEAIGSF